MGEGQRSPNPSKSQQLTPRLVGTSYSLMKQAKSQRLTPRIVGTSYSLMKQTKSQRLRSRLVGTSLLAQHETSKVKLLRPRLLGTSLLAHHESRQGRSLGLFGMQLPQVCAGGSMQALQLPVQGVGLVAQKPLLKLPFQG